MPRRTYVIDPRAPHSPFPPDVDLNVYVDRKKLRQGFFGRKLKEALLDKLVGSQEDDLFSDNIHGLHRRIYNMGKVNLSICIHELKPGDEIPTGEDDSVDAEERLQVRAFKLLLQRNGLYGGSSNLAFNGMACEYFIKCDSNPEQNLERALEILGELSRMERAERAEEIAENFPLIRKMSKYAWQRVEVMLETYRKTGKVKGGPYALQDWLEFNERYRQEQFDAHRIITGCGPGSPHCGVEGSDISNALCNAASGKLDYYVVPCQGNPFLPAEYGGRPHTNIFLRLPKGPKGSTRFEDLKKKFFQDDDYSIRDEVLLRGN